MKLSIATIVMETEIKNKHYQKKNLEEDIVLISNQLKIGLRVFIYSALLHQVDIVVKRCQKIISIRYQKQIKNFRENQKMNYENITALAYVLDYHIPTNVNKKAIFTELQQFFQNLLRYISHIPENEVSRIKPKVRNKCEMYYNVKVLYKYRYIVSKLSKRQRMVILKQNKRVGNG